MQDNQRSIQLLLEFDQAISWPDIKRVTSKALFFFDTHLALERISITLNDSQNKSMLVYTKDPSIPLLSEGDRHALVTPPLETDTSNKKPTYTANLSSVPHPSPVKQALIAAGIQSALHVPLVIGDEIVGALNVGSRQQDGIPPESQEIVSLLSARLSLALFHARLHDNLKEKDAALEASERNHRELIDQAADIIIQADMEGHILHTNAAAGRLLGYSNDELATMGLSDLFEPDILIRKPLRYDLIEAGLTVLAERVFRTKDGQLIPVEMNSRKLSDGTLVSIVRDLSERNIINEQILDQRNQLTAVFDASPTPMYAKDQEGRYTMLNDAYLEFFGKTRGEMLGKTVTEVWNTKGAEQVAREDRQLLESNDRQSYGTQYLHASGKKRQVLIRKARYLDAQGRAAGFVGTLMDFSELKAAEDRYETLFNNSPNPIVLHDGSVLLDANNAAIRFFKSDTPESYRNRPISEFIHPDSMEDSRRRIKELRTSKNSNELSRQKIIVATGEVRDVEVMAAPVEDQGRMVFMTAFRDVTDELATNEALINSEERYRSIFKYSPTAMVLHDKGVLLDANQAALNFAGAKSLDEVLGINLFSLVPPASRQVVIDGLDNLLERGSPLAGVREQKYLTLQGEERWVESSGVPVKQGDKTLVLLSFNDIHERVTAREEIEKSRQQLEVITQHIASYLFLVDLDLSLLYVNQAITRLLSTHKDELVGVSLKKIISTKDLSLAAKYLPAVINGEICSFSHHYTSLAQGDIDFNITMIPVKADDDQVMAILVQMDDVSEIESARKEIAENKELLELIVDTIPGLISYADMNEKYLYVNETYANWYGYKKDDIIGKTFAEIIPPDVYQEIKGYISSIPTGKQLSYTQILMGPDGREHLFDIRNLPHFDKNNQPKAFLSSIQDITEKREEEIFRDSLRRLARSLTVSLEPRQIGILSASLLYDIFDYDAFYLFKIDLENHIADGLFAQDTFADTDHPVEVKTDVNPLNLLPGVGKFILSSPELINRKKGAVKTPVAPFGDMSRVSLSLVYVPIFWEGVQIGMFSLQSYTPGKFQRDNLPKLKIFANQIGGALVRAQADELIQKQTAELKERELQLQATVAEKEVLLKEVYHRTKNNMQVIVGLLEMQGMKTNHAETQVVVDEMINRIYSMSMVHDLLYRSQNLAEIMLDTYLETLVNRLIGAYQTSLGIITLESQSIAIPVNIQTAIPLGLVVNEIVSNALKHAFPDHRNGKIIIKTKTYGKGGLVLEIGDNGVGIGEHIDLSHSETLGMKIIHDIADLQLFGELKRSTKKGVKYLLTIPTLKLD